MGMGDRQVDNLKTYDNVVHEYKRYDLYHPEQTILSRLRDTWHRTRMLDIGVGAGRTSYIFSAIVKEYIGIDYSAPMVTECKEIIGENERVSFFVCDACDLSQFYDTKFDFILFSCNGIDSVERDQRLMILSEVRKVLGAEGYFFFSTHSLHPFFPIKKTISPFNKRKPVRSLWYAMKDYIFLMRKKWLYRNVDVNAIKKAQWALLITGDHNFQMRGYHSYPDYQVKQLEDTGFAVESVYGRDGSIIDPSENKPEVSLYFLCQAR